MLPAVHSPRRASGSRALPGLSGPIYPSLHRVLAARLYLNNQVQLLVNMEATIRPHDHCRFAFLNDCRSAKACTGQQSIAVIDWCIVIASQLREIGSAAPFPGGVSNCLSIPGRSQAYLGSRAGRGDAPVNDFNRHRLAEPLVETAIRLFKRVDNRGDAIAAKPTGWKRNVYLVT